MAEQRVADPGFCSLGAGFFNVIPSLTFWDLVGDIADGYSVNFEYHHCTVPWEENDDAALDGKVIFELFEDRETVSVERFLHLIRMAIESEVRTNPRQTSRGMELLRRIEDRAKSRESSRNGPCK